MDLYCCDVSGCMKAYKSKVNLKRHKEAIHSDNKKYQCKDCLKVLSSNQNLKEHQLIHSQEMPFTCKIEGCGKRFRHGSQYSAHKRDHKVLNGMDSVDTKRLDVQLITRLLADMKDYFPMSVIEHDNIHGIPLPYIGTLQSGPLPNIFE
jgi:uncharacterized Zn-finger protein